MSVQLFDLAAHGRIKVTGEDRARLLHAMTTNHVQGLKPGDLGAILAQMNPDAAQKLTVKLAGRLALPQTVEAPTPAAPAAAAPGPQAAATPAAAPVAKAPEKAAPTKG